MVSVSLVCCFFFFKQKTAYEMRISDWSSDVCSSDLRLFRLALAVGGRGVDPVDPGVERLAQRLAPGRVVAMDQDAADPAGAEHDLGNQIGRASCRERVCQYV